MMFSSDPLETKSGMGVLAGTPGTVLVSMLNIWLERLHHRQASSGSSDV
jgi:hypothetical protein